MTLETWLGIELPIIQAPMAGVQGSALAVAVSNAGGLGSLPCGMLSLEAMREELKAITNATSKPFNVNFFCHKMPAPDAERELRWRRQLAPYYDEYDIDEGAIVAGPSRLPFCADMADIVCEFKPPVVSFHFGLPSATLLARVKTSGAKIISSATTLEEGRWLESHGVDAVIAQGLEAGGHRGHFLDDDLSVQADTAALLQTLLSELQVPVIAAGGVGSAEDVARMIAAGAAGVQVGTAYLLCPEASTSAVHRAAVSSDAAQHTEITNVFSGRPARGIVNRMMAELGPLASTAPMFPLATAAVSPLRTSAEQAGSGDFSPMWCGQNVSGCSEVSAATLTRHLGAMSLAPF